MIVISFVPRRAAGADDSHRVAALGERYHQKPLMPRVPDDDLAHLASGVSRIIENSCERVRKHGHGFLEGNAVLRRVDPSLTAVPFEDDVHRDRQAISQVPWRIVDAVSTSDRDLDVDALLAQLRNAERGDLVEITAPDAHVRIWID